MDKKTDVRDPDEKVVEIEMERLRAFSNHPFKVIGDSQMMKHNNNLSFVFFCKRIWIQNIASAHCRTGDGHGAFLLPKTR